MKKNRIIRGRRQKRFVKTKSILAFTIVFGLIFGLGAMAIIIGYQEVRGAFASPHWPSVNGTIIHSEIKKTEDTSAKSTTSPTVYSYQAEIKYEYYLDGLRLIGDRVRFGGVSNKAMAEYLTDKYKPDNAVQVYYDPDNLKKSVLEPGLSFGMLLLPLLGLVAVGCGILGIIIYFKFIRDP